MKLLAGLLVLSIIASFAMSVPTENQAESVLRAQRQAGGHHHHDSVDFGAHKGEHGSFGWYADFPVHGHGH
ncbi:uncharacterized protein LOC123004229 [Tribolium madens]|uniref:uncharacterized protein LOC123004229 n=1 Tax=Tribolium madens TaxID=41895 RepID=UPI001CF74D56|nr:uncharacterized protein LOC123004229 [Tribolium madens]